MQIHHLNCSTIAPIGGQYLYRGTKTYFVSHCLLIESSSGLILINTGLGVQDVLKPHKRLNSFFLRLFRPTLNLNETALYQVLALGFKASDVKHIILTHLDSDNIGGIEDFPHAQVHVMQAELEAALYSTGKISRFRYSPDKIRFSDYWHTYYAEGEKWFSFDKVSPLKDLPEDIGLISLCGYTLGHAAVVIKTDKGWLVHAGNSYFFRGELNQDYSCPPGIRFFQKIMQVNKKMRLLNQMRLRDLAHAHCTDVRIFCSRDPVEYEDLKNSNMKLFSSTIAGVQELTRIKLDQSNQFYHL